MTLKIKFVHMPFATLDVPSIAFTQLKTATLSMHEGAVTVDIHYLNHQFATLVGVSLYEFLAASNTGHVTGLGEWVFRKAAFPEEPDNVAEYLARYSHHFTASTVNSYLQQCLSLRDRLDRVLDDLIDRHGLEEADVIGCSSMFFQNLAAIALAQRLRRRNPRQIIVMGGANCEATMGVELATNVPVIDFVFSGPSLISFPQFIGCLLRGDREACHRIDGVLSRRNARSIASLPGDPAATDWGRYKGDAQVEGIGLLGRELDINSPLPLDYDEYLASLEQHLPEVRKVASVMFETSRGCWWGERAHCTFCGLNGSTMAYRALRPDLAVALVNGLIERYGARVDSLKSVDNILPKEYLDDVFPHLKVPDHMTIFYEVKSDLTRAQFATLQRAHVREIQPGIEALATSTLKLMRKGTTAFRNIRFLQNCREYQVNPGWNLLVGFPGETGETYAAYLRNLPMLYHLPPPSGAYPVRFDRFSPYFFRQREYGLRLAPLSFYGLCYPFPALALMNMAYYFEDLNTDAPYATEVAEWLARLRQVVSRWREAWAPGREPPRLELLSGPHGAYVIDTRTGAQRRSSLPPHEVAALRALGEPVAEDQMSSELRAALPSLRRRGLIFSERGRVMSIVTDAQIAQTNSRGTEAFTGTAA